MELCIQKQLLFIYTMYRRFELTGDFFTMKLLLILFVALQLLLPYGNSYRIVSNRFTSLGIRDFLYLHKRQSVSCRNRINSVEDGLSMISTDSEMKQSLKGFQDFIRTNPMSDKISANYFHHIEFYAGDATSTYKRFMLALGMELIAKSDFSTGNTLHASYLLQSGEMRMMFTAPYPKRSNDSKADDSSNELNNNNNNVVDGKSPSIPSFDSDKAINFFSIHGLGVRAVAIHVSNVKDSYETVIKNGGKSVLPPTVVTDSTDKGSIEMAEVNLYGDTVLRLINDNNFSGSFLPNFEDCKKISKDSLKQTVGRYGIERFDHIVGNVWSLSPIVEQLKNMTVIDRPSLSCCYSFQLFFHKCNQSIIHVYLTRNLFLECKCNCDFF